MSKIGNIVTVGGFSDRPIEPTPNPATPVVEMDEQRYAQATIASFMQSIDCPELDPDAHNFIHRYNDPQAVFDPTLRRGIYRLLTLGMGLKTACSIIGVSDKRFNEWRVAMPEFDALVRQAEGVSVGRAASLLEKLMLSADEDVQLRAVQFFLKTRSEDFRDKSTLEVGPVKDTMEAVRESVRRVYGLDMGPSGRPADAPPAAAPVLPEPSATGDEVVTAESF